MFVEEDHAVSHWWKGATLYQVYPLSFADSNDDGWGDLNGITAGLDHIQSLSVDAIWLSPVHLSPMRDWGYDSSDWRAIDPRYGSMNDFDTLLKNAHSRNIGIVLDQVYSYTSEDHDWFSESRKSPENDRSDWYVWADAKPDGTPPNNWLSMFGGPAWEWDPRRRQYYMHHFHATMPHLNFHNPAVQAEVLDTAEFWLSKGVDGFRLDVVNLYFHHSDLTDNPPTGTIDSRFPAGFQNQIYDRTRPENLSFLEDLRTCADRHGDKLLMAEVTTDNALGTAQTYCAPDRLHTAYVVLGADGPIQASEVAELVNQWDYDQGWPTWSISNHDLPRAFTRCIGADAPPEAASVLIAMLVALRGTILLYQGDELGLPQAFVPMAQRRDSEGVRFGDYGLQRDGARTPFPWTPEQADMWLPVDQAHRALAVSNQEQGLVSTLSEVRRLLVFRKAQPSLVDGQQRIEADGQLLKVVRYLGDTQIIALLNLGQNRIVMDAPKGEIAVSAQCTLNNGSLSIDDYGYCFILQTLPTN
jgi:alpha-glucosidase